MAFDALFGILCVLVAGGLVVAGTVFWVWMLIDCLTNEPSEGNDKLIWVLVIFFLDLLGGVIYYFARRPERIRIYGK